MANPCLPAVRPIHPSPDKLRHRPGMANPDAPSHFHLGYRPWLDGLRGLAILAVLAFHLGLLPGGFLGVDLFFVLSGFLITSLLVEEWERHGSIRLGRFYLRRALRLLPALFTLVLCCYLYAVLFRPAEVAAYRKEMLVALCYVSNWPTLHHVAQPWLGHTWSLSLEEQFYLIWPLLLYGMLRLGLSRSWIVPLVCAGIVASAAFRAGWFAWHHHDSDRGALVARLYFGLDSRADALLSGCLVALLAAWNLLPRSRRALFVIGAGSLTSALVLSLMFLRSGFDHSQFYYVYFALVALMMALILVRLLLGQPRIVAAVLGARPLVAIGRLSYGLYLVHIPIIAWLFGHELGWDHPVRTVLAVVLIFLAALLSYYVVERPFLRLKDRFSAVGPVDAAATASASSAGTVSPQAAA